VPVRITHHSRACPPQPTDSVLARASTSPASEAARRYATALFELAQDAGQLASVHRDFSDFAAIVRDTPELSRLIETPAVSREDKVSALTALAQAGGADPLLVRFFGTMAGNGRARDIPAAQRAFDEIYARQRGVQRAIATTAAPMSDAQRERIHAILSKVAQGEVELSEAVDQDIIGGIQLRIGSKLVDASLAAKLARMNTAMKGA
jgi:F-type H+-transporting ATPase subunit delta